MECLKKHSSYLWGKGKNDEESQGGISTYEKWNHVCSLLTGKIDLFTEERSFRIPDNAVALWANVISRISFIGTIVGMSHS